MKKYLTLKTISSLLLSLILVSYSLPTNLVKAVEVSSQIITPDAVIICPVHYDKHYPARSALTKFAFYKDGPLYNASEYTCDCGATIEYTSDLPTYNYYWFVDTTYWTMPYWLPGAMQYDVPNPYYKTTSLNPPNWQINWYE